MKKIEITIEKNRWYKISEIVKHGFILNTKGKPDRRRVWKLILEKKLDAKNEGFSKKKPLYIVKGASIIKYLNK